MTNEQFAIEAQRLSGWFNRKMNETQIAIMFDSLKYIPPEAFRGVVSEIIKSSKVFPTINEIQNLYREKYRRDHPEETSRSYNQDETECEYYKRITVSHLWQAYNILKNNGKEQFLRFCRVNNFSDDDIERVEWKLKYSITPEKLEKKIKTVFNPERIEILKEQAQKITETGVPF